MLMLGKFLYNCNERVLVLTFSGVCHKILNRITLVMLLLHKYIGDILPTFQIETML